MLRPDLTPIVQAEQIKLLPCPFCGSDGKMISCLGACSSDGFDPDGVRVTCSDPECHGDARPAYGEDMDARAVVFWNTRAAQRPTAPVDRETLAQAMADALQPKCFGSGDMPRLPAREYAETAMTALQPHLSTPPRVAVPEELRMAGQSLAEALHALLEGMEVSGGWEGDDALFDKGMAALKNYDKVAASHPTADAGSAER